MNPISKVAHEHYQHTVTDLVERGNGSRGVAAEAIAFLDCGDGALEVGAVQQLGELQEAVAQHKQLGQTNSTGGLSLNYVAENIMLAYEKIEIVCLTAASCCQTYS